MFERKNRTNRKKDSIARSKSAVSFLAAGTKQLSANRAALFEKIADTIGKEDQSQTNASWSLVEHSRELERRVRLSALLRLDALQIGKIITIPINGWPREWINSSKKLYVVVDARRKRIRAIFLTRYRQKTSMQWFWIKKHPNAFGKEVYQFQDPHSGAYAENVIYQTA